MFAGSSANDTFDTVDSMGRLSREINRFRYHASLAGISPCKSALYPTFRLTFPILSVHVQYLSDWLELLFHLMNFCRRLLHFMP